MEVSSEKEKLKWYFNPVVIFLSMLVFGPLGLILLWYRPRTHIAWKIGITVVILAVTIWFTRDAVNYYREMASYIENVAADTQPQ